MNITKIEHDVIAATGLVPIRTKHHLRPSYPDSIVWHSVDENGEKMACGKPMPTETQLKIRSKVKRICGRCEYEYFKAEERLDLPGLDQLIDLANDILKGKAKLV